MNVSDGTVISSIHRKHRSIEFKKFLVKIDKTVPEHLDIHVVCDNYATHKHPTIQTWLGKHPRFHMHFTPTYSSWINQVERLFAEVTRELLQRSDYRSVQALEKDLRNWVTAWNEDPKPFIWTKTAEEILASIARYLKRINGADIVSCAVISLLDHYRMRYSVTRTDVSRAVGSNPCVNRLGAVGDHYPELWIPRVG